MSDVKQPENIDDQLLTAVLNAIALLPLTHRRFLLDKLSTELNSTFMFPPETIYPPPSPNSGSGMTLWTNAPYAPNSAPYKVGLGSYIVH